MKLKTSRYNYVFNGLEDGSFIMYNSRTGALAIIDKEHYQSYVRFLEKGEEIEQQEFLNQLLQCGFLLPEGIDELFLIRTTLMKNRYDNRSLYLTIAPTMACNFRCIYCFEQGYYGKSCMDNITIENVIKFIEERIKDIERIHISWFGGEPLLAMPIIERISERIINICDKSNVAYSAGIVTNGYFYTKDVAKKLKELKVDSVQITLDGSEEVHNRRRPLINGEATYSKITKNLVDTYKIIPVNLRINVDRDCVDTINEIMTYLRNNNLLDHIIPYLGFVLPYGEKYQKEKCLTTEMYSNLNLKFWKENNIPLQSKYPIPRGNYCMADLCNGWVIDDKGSVYKCWNEIGLQNRSLGNVNNSISFMENTDILKEFLEFDPITDEECKGCKVLPLCMGGCAYNRRNGLEKCEQRRYNMEEYIVQCVKAILKE